jgi:Cu/Ag efflux protein CusF
MRSLIALAALLPALAPAPLGAAQACCPAPEAAAAEVAKPKGHPLRGVILSIMPERSSLLVKHEEIPGVMRAMTMLLRVDAETLAAAQKNQAITATLVKKDDGWWLIDVSPATPASPGGA